MTSEHIELIIVQSGWQGTRVEGYGKGNLRGRPLHRDRRITRLAFSQIDDHDAWRLLPANIKFSFQLTAQRGLRWDHDVGQNDRAGSAVTEL